MQAWAQNLGHESLTTTFGSYGKVAPHEQGELVRNAGKMAKPTGEAVQRLMALMEEIRDEAGPVSGKKSAAAASLSAIRTSGGSQ